MNTDNEVFSESLAYAQVKKRATASRSYRVKIPSSNGTSFSPGQTINIDLPSNQAGSYANMNQAYLKFKVTYSGANGAILDRNGAYNFIKRLSIQTAGTMISDIQNYNVLTCAMMDMQSTHEWKASSGKQLIGCYGDALRGEGYVANDTRTYCLPIILNCLSNTTPHRLIPLFSLSNLQLRFQLESAAAALVGAAAGYIVSDVEYVCMITELSPGSQSKVDAMTNGDYNILALNFMNATASQGAAQNTVTANLGFSMSSLERIIVCHRKTDAATGDATVFSNSRISNGLDQYNFLINSQQYPDRPIMISEDRQGAEVWAETLISDHRLTDFGRGCPINTGLAKVPHSSAGSSDLTGSAPSVVKINSYLLPAASAAGTTAGATGAAADASTTGTATISNIGTFVASAEFESGLSDGKSSHIYSGISTIGSTVQYVGNYTGAVACQLDFFAVYTVLLNLNMRGLGTWQIRV